MIKLANNNNNAAQPEPRVLLRVPSWGDIPFPGESL